MEGVAPTEQAPGTPIDVDAVKRMYNMALAAHACSNTAEGAAVAACTRPGEEEGDDRIDCDDTTQHCYGVDAVEGDPAVPAMPTTTDPGMLQVAISYAIGDTSVGLSWYQSTDKATGMDRSSPRSASVWTTTCRSSGANVYAAAQNYSVEMVHTCRTTPSGR